MRGLQSNQLVASLLLDPEEDLLSPTGQSCLVTQSISMETNLLQQEFEPDAGPSNISELQQAGLQEHTAGVETMYGSLSHRVSATPSAVNADSNDSRSLLQLQPADLSRLGTGNTGTQGIRSSGLDGTNQTQDAPGETTLGATDATGTIHFFYPTMSIPTDQVHYYLVLGVRIRE
jgi:hypothetical protein